MKLSYNNKEYKSFLPVNYEFSNLYYTFFINILVHFLVFKN